MERVHTLSLRQATSRRFGLRGGIARVVRENCECVKAYFLSAAASSLRAPPNTSTME